MRKGSVALLDTSAVSRYPRARTASERIRLRNRKILDYEYNYNAITTEQPRPTPGLVLTTTTSGPFECQHDNKWYADGSSVDTEDPCEHCYCMKGDIVCAVQECKTPFEKDGHNCTAMPPAPGKCCPDSYHCGKFSGRVFGSGAHAASLQTIGDLLKMRKRLGRLTNSHMSNRATGRIRILILSDGNEIVDESEPTFRQDRMNKFGRNNGMALSLDLFLTVLCFGNVVHA